MGLVEMSKSIYRGISQHNKCTL